METNNETVAEITGLMSRMKLCIPRGKVRVDDFDCIVEVHLSDFADRILAAHKREMAHNESLLSKAGETVVGLMNKMNAQHEEIKKLRALVKGLYEASSTECACCGYDCGRNRENCIMQEAVKYLNESEVVK